MRMMGGKREKDAQRVLNEPYGGEVTPSEEVGAGRDEEGKENAPELPDDGISSVFERVGELHLEITAVVVVCGRFLVLWRHGGDGNGWLRGDLGEARVIRLRHVRRTRSRLA
jgi:hypothetical protein